MSEMNSQSKELGLFSKIIAVFTSPKEAFESIDRKPTWLIPFLLVLLVVVFCQYLVMDLQTEYQIASMEARGNPAEQIQAVTAQAEGPMRYIQLAGVPIVLMIMYLIMSGLYFFAGNVIGGGQAKFKNVFAMVCWTSLISILAKALLTYLQLSKGSMHGVGTSLALLLPTPAIGETTSVLYRLLSQIEVFSIWQNIVLIFGFSVIFKFSLNKAMVFVLVFWALQILLAVVLGGLFGGAVQF